MIVSSKVDPWGVVWPTWLGCREGLRRWSLETSHRHRVPTWVGSLGQKEQAVLVIYFNAFEFTKGALSFDVINALDLFQRYRFGKIIKLQRDALCSIAFSLSSGCPRWGDRHDGYQRAPPMSAHNGGRTIGFMVAAPFAAGHYPSCRLEPFGVESIEFPIIAGALIEQQLREA